ncbi:type III secretion system export apparatus subunit SctT [Algicola sagamiensis]|uniref:type III secretion system export apparatus subunit SctT n=1 Tax=Algicola sagamiensis TaxID=163869 RepID=UPI0003750AA9|nr:type III secretion system export apparatus subunit SctT [Algicola sagamiensis]
MFFKEFEHAIITFAFLVPRVLAAFTVLPFLGKSMLGGAMTRNGVAFALIIFMFPVANHQIEQITHLSPTMLSLVLFKEILIGILFGYIAAIPFWAIESVGFFIDNQRGATMASSMNPLSGSQTSPLGILLVQVVVTIFFVGGSFLFLLGAIYQSYIVWPIFSPFPQFNDGAALLMLGQLDYIMSAAVLLGGPIIIAMFLSEFGLALISRFAPQLNVFFLAMPIKSAIAGFLLIFYLKFLLVQWQKTSELGPGLIEILQGWLV